MANERTLPSAFVLASLVATACAPTLAHPMRVTPGLFVEGALLGYVPNGRRVSCHADCGDITSEPPRTPIPVAYASIGWGALVDPHVGLLAGLTYPARSEVDPGDAPFAYAPRLFGLITMQDGWGSLGLGTDLGIMGAAWTLLAEVRPGEGEYWAPAIGVFHRWYVPYVFREGRRTVLGPGDTVTIDSLQPAWDLGARISAGFLFVQWSITVETDGLRGYPYYEGGDFSEMRHTISVGIVVQASCAGPGCVSHDPFRR